MTRRADPVRGPERLTELIKMVPVAPSQARLVDVT